MTMQLSKDEIQRAFRIRKAIQKYLDQTNKVNIRSTDVFPYLVRRGLFEKDSKNGLYFRRFLKKLYLCNMLHLIPQCKYVPGINGEIFGEWYFNSFATINKDPFIIEKNSIETPDSNEVKDLKDAEEIIINLIEGKHPETRKPLNPISHSALMIVQKSLKIISSENKIEKEKSQKHKTSSVEKKVSTYIEEQRKIYEKAYFPWTPEDDQKLELLFCEGKSNRELSKIFKRNPGSISSRIKKLELSEKYGK